MNTQLLNIVKPFCKAVSLDFYIRISGKKQLLPFYHTVSDFPKPHFSEIGYYRTKRQFLEDLDFFSRNYKSVEIYDLNERGKHYHLSFDDGMSEVYENVAPELIKRKINATFFVNPDFVDNKKMFFRHKANLLINEVKRSPDSKNKAECFLSLAQKDIENHLFELRDENRIDEIAKQIHVKFEDYLQEHKPYLDMKQLRDMQKMGFTIGNHSKNHPNFNQISFEEQKFQILETNKFLEEKLQADGFYFAFPYGDFNIANEFFNWMYDGGNIMESFGVSGLKEDGFARHHHRILMEYKHFSAEEIVKFEYFSYLLKMALNKNKIKR